MGGKAHLLAKENIVELVLLALFAMMPFSLYVNSVLLNGFSVAGVSAVNALTMLVLALCTINSLWTANYKSIEAYSAFMASLFFLLALLFKLFFQGGAEEAYGWIRQCQYYLLTPLMLFVVSNIKMPLSKVVNLLLLVSIPVCFVSLYSFVSSDYFDLIPYETMEEYAIVGTSFCRMMGTFGSPNVAGCYYAIMLILVIFMRDEKRGLAAKESSVLRAIQFSLLTVCLILSFSRMALIGFSIGVFIYIVTNKSSRKKAVRGPLAGILFAGIIVILIIVLMNSGAYFWGISDFVNNPRLEKWAAFFKNYGNWIILGSPIGQYIVSDGTTLSDSSLLLLVGFIGLIPAIIYIALFLRPVITPCRMGSKYMAAVVMLLVFVLLSDFISLYPSAYMAIIMLRALDKHEVNIDEGTGSYSLLPLSTR